MLFFFSPPIVLLHRLKSNSLALGCLFMFRRWKREKFKFSINVQYYVSNLNYMNHLLKLIRETDRQFSLLCLHFKLVAAFFSRLMLHLTCICLSLGFAFSQCFKAAVGSSGMFLLDSSSFITSSHCAHIQCLQTERQPVEINYFTVWADLILRRSLLIYGTAQNVAQKCKVNSH